MRSVVQRVICIILIYGWSLAVAQPSIPHPWRPPFGLDRVGAQEKGPSLEADARARPEQLINPVELGTNGMTSKALGAWLGLIYGLGGIFGALTGGLLVSRWFADDERRQMQMSSVAFALVIVFHFAFLLLPQRSLALLALFPLIANLLGAGLGPQIVGALSDLLVPISGTDSLRYAMLLMSFTALWASFHFWKVGATVGEDLAVAARSAQDGFMEGASPSEV